MNTRIQPIRAWSTRTILVRIFSLLLVVLTLTIAGLAASPLPVAHAADLSVTNCSTFGDSSQPGTLGYALAQAASSSGSTISFACGGTITVPTTISVGNTLTIRGSGQSVMLDGGNSVQVFSVASSGKLTLDGLTVAHGKSSGDGGGVYNNGSLTITNSTFSGNSAPYGGRGGGVYNNGSLTITNSTFSGNSAGYAGGGVGSWTSSSSTTTVVNSTFSGNSSPQGGGFNISVGTQTITNSIVTQNTGSPGNGGNCWSIQGGSNYRDGGYNLSDPNDNSCIFSTANHDVLIADPMLGSLTDNGGPTQTIALLEGSPAIDRIPVATNHPSTDQRGYPRPDEASESAFDIGAYESSYAEAPTDSTAPTTTATGSPTANAAGWNNSDVTITLSTTDNTGGSGVKATYYTVNDGAQQTYDSSKGIVISTAGQYTIKYWSVDNAGNTEAAQTLAVKLDKTPPTVSCGSPDGQWHADNVSIACTADDSDSSLANSADASFSLTTNVQAGTETANAATDSRTVTDVAGNSVTAGPIAGNKVDQKAPTITITTPADGTTYYYGHSDTANYSARDDGSGVKTVEGTVPNGGSLTGSVGNHDFSVTATDNVGNTATSPTLHYTVIYEWSGILQPVNADGSSIFKLGSTVPVKFQLTGASAGVSNAVVKLYYSRIDNGIEGTVTEAVSTAAADSGNIFRYDSTSQQYVFNLGTKGLTAGTYKLKFYVGGDNNTPVVLQGEVIISLKK